jgi:hypothetical protein
MRFQPIGIASPQSELEARVYILCLLDFVREPSMPEPTARLGRIAILWRGDEAARRSATPETSRFKAVFAALADVGVDANPVVYEDDVPDTVRAQLGTPTSAKITTPCQVGSSLGFSRSLVAPVLPQQLQLLCSRC